VTTAKVFVSYSHNDDTALKELQPFLTSLEWDGLLSCWADTRLKGGDDWEAGIYAALNDATVAVLLISQDFLASEFIRNKELPRILPRAHAGNLKVLSILLSPSSVDDDEFVFTDLEGKCCKTKLTRWECYGRPEKTLSKLSPSDRKEEYKKLNKRLRELSKGEATVTRSPAPPLTNSVTAARRPPATGESAVYELTIHLERRGDDLGTAYYLPGSAAIASATRAWKPLLTPLEDIAEQLDSQRDPSLQSLLAQASAEWGARLFDLLFGPESQWEGVLRTLFDQPPPAPRPNPSRKPVRLRICTDEPLLLGLPWRLTAWNATLLVDRDWEFSTSGEIDPKENFVTAAPCNVLIVAPQAQWRGVAPDPAHAQAIVEVLQRVWPSSRKPEYARIVGTRSELAKALRGMHPHLIYVYGHGSVDGNRPSLLLDGPRGLEELPLAELAKWCRDLPAPPAVIYLNVTGLTNMRTTPVEALADVPLLIWRRLPVLETDTASVACTWLNRWLQQGEDPVTALHEASRRPASAAVTLAAHNRYRSWTTTPPSLSSPQGPPHLALNRDEQKALVDKHLKELVRSDTRRVMALVAYATPGNLLGSLHEQLRSYLDLEASGYAESNWRRLQFPIARHNLRQDLEDELKLQLECDSNEAVRHLLRRHAPNTRGTGKRGVLWLNWGLCGHGCDCQAPLTPAQLSDWLRFSSEFIGANCPDDLRIVSYLAIELAQDRIQRLAEGLDGLLEQSWCRSPLFRLEKLQPGGVGYKHLFDFLVDQHSGCPPGIWQEVAQRLIAKTGGVFKEVVALIEEAQNSSWNNLLNRLQHQQDAPQPLNDEPF